MKKKEQSVYSAQLKISNFWKREWYGDLFTTRLLVRLGTRKS